MQSMTAAGVAAPAIVSQKNTKTLMVENIPITLIDQGSGTPTLLLHGIFDSSATWSGVVERLQGSFRLLVPDLPGFGSSDVSATFDGHLPYLAQFIDNLLDAAGIHEPINLVGYDVGATYGLAWAVTHPEKVRRMAIMNANFFSDYKWHIFARLFRIPLLGELIMSTVNESSYARGMLKGAPGITAEQARAAAKLVTPKVKRMALLHYRALDSVDFRGWEDRLRELTAKVPTIVLWGDKDPFVSPDFAERFGAGEVHHFKDSGHWLPLEAPAELSARIAAFFSAGDD